MKPAPFDYVQPASLAEAVRCLTSADDDEGKILAGGQSLIPMMSLRLARPSLLVDLAKIRDLNELSIQGDSIRIGAMTRHRALAQQGLHPLAAEAARWIGHTAIRSRGTIGGSLAHADAAAELPLVATACAAELQIVGPSGNRSQSVDSFFEGTLQTALGEHEIIEGVALGRPKRWGFAELARRHGDFALVAVVVAEIRDMWRVVVGGVQSVPYRASRAEDFLMSRDLDVSAVAEAALLAGNDLDTFTDLHASANYRRGMVEELTRQALTQALTQTHDRQAGQT